MAKGAASKIEDNWPASRVEMWALDRIIPYDKNPRQHSAEQIDLLAKSMKDDGVIAPILTDEKGVIIYGHGRRLAAAKNKFKEYPVVVARGWSDEKKRAIRIKDNQIGLISTWDIPLLRQEATDLKLIGYDVELLGFGETMSGWLVSGDIVDNLDAEWNGMPGFNQEDKTSFKSIVVHFKDQESVDKFAKIVKQKITPKTRSMWYPEAEIETYMDKRYIAK